MWGTAKLPIGVSHRDRDSRAEWCMDSRQRCWTKETGEYKPRTRGSCTAMNMRKTSVEGPRPRDCETRTLEMRAWIQNSIVGSQRAVGQQSIETIDNTEPVATVNGLCMAGGWHEDSSGATDSVEACWRWSGRRSSRRYM